MKSTGKYYEAETSSSFSHAKTTVSVTWFFDKSNFLEIPSSFWENRLYPGMLTKLGMVIKQQSAM